MVDLWGRRWTRDELLARVGRLEQLAGVNDQGLVGAAVASRAAETGVFQRYPRASLPHHITWRQLGSGTYVVAMEPSTNRDAGRFDARSRGELRHLAPGEQRRYQLEIGALTTTSGGRT